MSGVIESGSARPRPLSGGFWTLLSWLRGDEHSSSSDSISSVGSDRTAVSFAFLAPAHYHAGTAAPLVLPPPGPPTDSYKKRVRERNLRRQYDRDITLHRKYGLFRGEGVVNFDANSLPPARRAGTVNDRKDRERRAASECLQRRTAHVPGKRRAPSPPQNLSPSNRAGPSCSTIRRHTRKRPAPKPPSELINKSSENILNGKNKFDMNPSSSSDTQPSSPVALNCKPVKYAKKDSDFKDVKVRSEKSFLKQIFENKKKTTIVDISSIKILPSISELDKQAAEIIETSKARRESQMKQDHNIMNMPKENVWYCIKCSKMYNKNVESCLKCKIKRDISCTSVMNDDIRNVTIYTQTEDKSPSPSTSKKQEIDEKQRLKEMLKEMKDSLPKRTKPDNLAENDKNQEKPINRTRQELLILETPTLPIGSSIEKNKLSKETSESKNILSNKKEINLHRESNERHVNCVQTQTAQSPSYNNEAHVKTKLLNTPLRISSLLNPIYIPKPNSLREDQLANVSSPINLNSKQEIVEPTTTEQIYVKTADAVRNILLNTAASSPIVSPQGPKSKIIKDKPSIISLNKENAFGVTSNNICLQSSEKNYNIAKLNHHSRRRDLVNQLEKSIANGDERAAADAAMKLAQLRLSCSVLSFSSQILQQPQNASKNVRTEINADKSSKPATGTSKENVDNTVLNSTSHFKVEINKKGNDTHDASTSTNNVLIKRNTNVLIESAAKCKNEVKLLPIRNNEFPNESKMPIGSDNSAISAACYNNRDPSKQLIQGAQSKNGEKVSELETNAQPSTSKEKNGGDGNPKSIAVWIEDKEKAHGPIRLQISANANIGELRRQAEQVLGLPLRLQRWIVGKELCNNDDTTLASLAGPDLNTPFYLCVVECDKNVQGIIRDLCEAKAGSLVGKSHNNEENTSAVYQELVNLERQAVVPNAEYFECEICIEHCAAGDGVVLRECVHSFCRQCLSDVIRHCEEPAVSCPAIGCPGLLHEREIRALVTPEEYERWLNRGLAAAESGTRNAFHCRTRDCTGWALCEAGARRFPCPVCKHINCVQCQAIHEGETCDQYRKKLEDAATKTAQTDEGTQALIQSLISRGEALQCPECSAVITKKWGCDWVKCSACKTEICWVTRGRRWGPAGRGDTSGGCKCGVDGKRCHPSCGYCH